MQTDTWTNNYHISSQKQTGTKKEHVIKNEEDRESKQTQTDVKKTPFRTNFDPGSIRNDTQNRTWGYPCGAEKNQVVKGPSPAGKFSAPLDTC